MFAFLTTIRKPLRALLGSFVLGGAIAACTPVGTSTGANPSVDTSAPIPVALLVPKGAGGGGGIVGQSLENAARLAVADLGGVDIDLRVYDTLGNAQTAASMAQQAVSEGARIIVGPLFSQSVTAVTQATSGRNVNVLAFSNNEAVAGGNVFILGQTFSNVADRLSAYAARQGRSSVVVVHSDDLAGQTGRDAIVRRAESNGMRIAGIESYPLSQQGVLSAGPRIAETVRSTGATAVFLTANVDSDLPLIATTLPESGVSPAQVRYIGLTRWNSLPQALSLPGLQGGLFALPDQSVQTTFENRYRSTYGQTPHPLAGLAYDAIQAVGSLAAGGRSDALSANALTQRAGFAGATGIFRLLPNGTNERALAVAQIQNNQVVVVDPAPRRFGGAGF